MDVIFAFMEIESVFINHLTPTQLAISVMDFSIFLAFDELEMH
jgi:hypothetical protein